MNVFVLNTGRCGSTTFANACHHITNFTSGHESLVGRLCASRLRYPDNHIEVDNRLSWRLGRLDKAYGDSAFYVHLRRQDTMKTVISFSQRNFPGSIIDAYRNGILLRCPPEADIIEVSRDFCETVTANIELFLKDKTNRMDFTLEKAKTDFVVFWERIGAEGNLDAALAEFDVHHNATKPKRNLKTKVLSRVSAMMGDKPTS